MEAETPSPGDGAVNLTSNSPQDDCNPAFSPDGTQLVFSSKRNGGKHNLNLWRMGADGANPVALTSDPDADNVNLPGSAWNATSGRITFSSDRVANDEIWTMLPDGRSVTRVTPDPAPDWEPSWSPNGRWIAFQSERSGNWDIYKAKVSTGRTVRLTRRPASDWEPNWGPSGDIAFQSNRDGNWEIYAVDARGGPQTNLTNSGAEDTDPSWNPDGSRIVFSSDRGDFGEAEIFVLDAGGSGAPPVRVTSDPAYDGAPSWSPDGTIIVFESDRSGNLDIWTIPASA